MPAATVRAILATDVDTIASIHATSWRNAYRGMLRDEFLDDDLVANRRALWTARLVPLPAIHFGFIASAEQRPAGFCFAFGDADSRWGTMLDNLHVLPEFKSRGIGRLLLAEFANRAAQHRTHGGLFLWVYENNVAARQFYERLGAKPVERAVVDAPGGGQVAEWRYAWPSPDVLLSALQGDASQATRR